MAKHMKPMKKLSHPFTQLISIQNRSRVPIERNNQSILYSELQLQPVDSSIPWPLRKKYASHTDKVCIQTAVVYFNFFFSYAAASNSSNKYLAVAIWTSRKSTCTKIRFERKCTWKCNNRLWLKSWQWLYPCGIFDAPFYHVLRPKGALPGF